MHGNGRRHAIGGIPPNRMLAAFPIKLAAVCEQVLFERELGGQANTNSSRRVGSCFFGQFAVGLEDHSKRIFQVLASLSKILPWVLTPGTSSTKPAHQLPTCLYTSGQFHVCIFLAFGLLVQSLAAREIVPKPLDELVIYNLPIAFKSGNTTVLFPSAISGLHAKSVAIHGDRTQFLISFTPGNYYFTVRALKRDAEDHLTVIYNRKAYVLLHPSTRGPTQSRLTRSRRPMPKLCSSRTKYSRSGSMRFSRKTPQSRIFKAKSNG